MDRADGRLASTLRPLSCELGTLHNADGSALWKSGSTQVLAAVHGPVAPRQPQHETQKAKISIIIKSGTTVNTLEREWEAFLTKALTACLVTEQYPRSVIQIVLQILSADGSVLGAALNGAVAALMDAGIAMKVLPVAVTCLISEIDNSTIQLDPSLEEEQVGGVVVLVSESATPGKILACHTSGVAASMDVILRCCAVAERAAPAIPAFWRIVIEQKATREAQTLWSL